MSGLAPVPMSTGSVAWGGSPACMEPSHQVSEVLTGPTERPQVPGEAESTPRNQNKQQSSCHVQPGAD